MSRGILESMVVRNLPALGADKTLLRTWNDRLVNVMSQLRPGTRKIFQFMMEYVDQERGGNFEELFKATHEFEDMKQAGTPVPHTNVSTRICTRC